MILFFLFAISQFLINRCYSDSHSVDIIEFGGDIIFLSSINRHKNILYSIINVFLLLLSIFFFLDWFNDIYLFISLPIVLLFICIIIKKIKDGRKIYFEINIRQNKIILPKIAYEINSVNKIKIIESIDLDADNDYGIYLELKNNEEILLLGTGSKKESEKLAQKISHYISIKVSYFIDRGLLGVDNIY